MVDEKPNCKRQRQDETDANTRGKREKSRGRSAGQTGRFEEWPSTGKNLLGG